jgi:hypothetical protein
MPSPSIDDVKPLLRSRESAISRVFVSSWDSWWRNPDRLVLHYKRTRATNMHNYMMNATLKIFSDDHGIRPIEGLETYYFVVEQRLVFRLKMGDDCGISRNNETQTSLAFVDPQQSFPEIPDLDRVDIVYVLNPLETLIDRILVVARDCERVVWSYPIYPRSYEGKSPVTLPTRPVPLVPPDNVVHLPVVKKEEKDTDK